MASAFIPRWSASSGSTRTACWPSSTAAATTIRACRTSRRWGSGTPGVPNGGEPLGWLGRLADERYDASTRNLIVNLGNVPVARRAKRPALAARLRRSGPLPPRGHRQREAGARRTEPAESDVERDARVPGVDGRERHRKLRLRAPGVGQLSHAGGLRARRRTGRQPPAGRGAHRRRDADAPVLRHLLRATRSTPTCSRRISTAGC